MVDLARINQNITYEKNFLKEKEIAFHFHTETDIKNIEDLDIQIDSLKKNFTQNLKIKKKVFFFLLI